MLIALGAGNALLFFVANIFPIASMNIEGIHTSATLAQATLALLAQGRPLVAALVFVTTILIPALQLVVLLYLLFSLRHGRVPPGVTPGYRFLRAARPWSMTEVFLLGVLVTLFKLSELASIIPGVALWAFASSVMLATALAAAFNGRDFWAWVETVRKPAAGAA